MSLYRIPIDVAKSFRLVLLGGAREEELLYNVIKLLSETI